jgi:hypothetical protein
MYWGGGRCKLHTGTSGTLLLSEILKGKDHLKDERVSVERAIIMELRGIECEGVNLIQLAQDKV